MDMIPGAPPVWAMSDSEQEDILGKRPSSDEVIIRPNYTRITIWGFVVIFILHHVLRWV
jgi:hypothetical protein